MGDVKDPAEDPGGVLLRTVSVLQDRIREVEYQDLQARLDSRSLEGIFFIHTQKELDPNPLDWINCQDPCKVKEQSSLTSYGIDKMLQNKIASIRTDLDSFTEVEAYALMASGYMMTNQQLLDLNAQHIKDGNSGTWGGFDVHASQLRGWPFLRLRHLLAEEPGENASEACRDLALQLDVGKELFFKAWFLIPWLKFLSYALLGFAVFSLVKLIILYWSSKWVIPVSVVVTALLGIPVALFLPAMKWLNPKQETRSIVIKVAIAFTGYLMAKLHLNIFDHLFLARGKLEDLLKLAKK